MNIERHIDNWTRLILNESSLILEGKTPHDENSLMNSFSKDVTDEKYYPTKEFLETAYGMLNDRLFGNKLTEHRLTLQVKSLPRSGFLGYASYMINRMTNTMAPIGITLNSSRTLTLHEWLESVLHEMVHVYDYSNYPEHYLGYNRKYYDPHGQWFLNYGKQFEKYGFHVEKYCNADIGINMDDSRVKGRMNGSVFILLDGYMSKTGQPSVIMISAREIDKYKQIFSKGVKNGRFSGLKKLVFLKSENPSIIKLKQVRMKNEHSGMSYYYFTQEFKEKYGPFEEIESYEISSNISEDKDETEFDDMNRIDDEFARKMYDNIGGIVDIKKKNDESYEVSIA